MSALPDAKPANSLPEFASKGDSATHPADSGGQPASWQRELAQAIRDPQTLLAALDIGTADCPQVDLSGVTTFPMLVPSSFLRRMRRGDPHDPLLRQVLPTRMEQEFAPGLVDDAVGDLAARQAPGLLQKYGGRALLVAAGSCAVHCRYCFRRNYPYADEPRRLSDWEDAIGRLVSDASVSEVILSGGDPLMLPDDRLAALVVQLDAIPNVTRIRLHTRLPIVLPSRLTPELLDLLSGLRAQPVVVVHANHANEIQGDCRLALQTLVRQGLPVLNQAVLLRSVNDSVNAQVQLSQALIDVGVMPYYLHQADAVRGTAHFHVPVSRGREIVNGMRSQLPGYGMPRYVQEIPGEVSKTPLELH